MTSLLNITQTIHFGTDGFVEIRHNGVQQSRQRWLPVGANASDYQVRVTVTQQSSGTLTNALTNWTSMGSNRTVTYVNTRQSTDGAGTSQQYVRLSVSFRRTAFVADSITAEIRLNNNATLQLPVWSGQLRDSLTLEVNAPVTRQVEAPAQQNYAARFMLSCTSATGIALRKEQFYNPGNEGGGATTNVIDTIFINPRTSVAPASDFQWRMVHVSGTNFANTSHFTTYRALTDNNNVFYGWLYQTTAPVAAATTDQGVFRIDVRRISTNEVRSMNLTLRCINQLLEYEASGPINPPQATYNAEYYGADANFAGVGLLIRQEGNYFRVRRWIADSINGPFPSNDGDWDPIGLQAWNDLSSPFNYGDHRFRATIISAHEDAPGSTSNFVAGYTTTTATANSNSTVVKHTLTGGLGASAGQLRVTVEVQQISTGQIVYQQIYELNTFTIN